MARPRFFLDEDRDGGARRDRNRAQALDASVFAWPTRFRYPSGTRSSGMQIDALNPLQDAVAAEGRAGFAGLTRSSTVRLARLAMVRSASGLN